MPFLCPGLFTGLTSHLIPIAPMMPCANHDFQHVLPLSQNQHLPWQQDTNSLSLERLVMKMKGLQLFQVNRLFLTLSYV